MYKYKKDKNDELLYLPEPERFAKNLSTAQKCELAAKALGNDKKSSKRKNGNGTGMTKLAKKLKKINF